MATDEPATKTIGASEWRRQPFDERQPEAGSHGADDLLVTAARGDTPRRRAACRRMLYAQDRMRSRPVTDSEGIEEIDAAWTSNRDASVGARDERLYAMRLAFAASISDGNSCLRASR